MWCLNNCFFRRQQKNIFYIYYGAITGSHEAEFEHTEHIIDTYDEHTYLNIGIVYNF